MQNIKNNIYIDLGNSCTKFGYYHNINEFKVISINNHKLNKAWIEKLTNNINLIEPKFYICSVNEKHKIKLIKILEDLNYWFYCFNHHDLITFKTLFKHQIEFNQIGLDLLFDCYYLMNENNCLILILGTVFVFIKKTDNLVQGFLFLPNLLKTYQQLLNKIHLNSVSLDTSINNNYLLSFGISNDECFNNSISLLFSNFINEVIKNEYIDFDKIIVSGGASDFFKNKYLNINQYKCEYIDNLCVLGIKKFIENK